MLSQIRAKYYANPGADIFYLFGALFLVSVVGYVVWNEVLWLAVPFLFVLAGVFLMDLKLFYYGLLAAIPLSIEYYLSNNLSTDLPSEPLMILLTMGLVVTGILRIKQIPASYVLHPISLLLALHFVWVVLTGITSYDKVISLKFILAKFWYIVPFYAGTLFFLGTMWDIKRLVIAILIPLTLIVIWVLTRHAIEGFTFVGANQVIHPFFRNHVNYASLLVVFLPYIWFYHRVQARSSQLERTLLISIGVLFVTAIFFSYTRAAFVSLGIMVVAYFLIRRRWLKYVILLSLVLGTFWIVHLVQNNRYLRYAPNFEQTIAHKDFESLLSATYKLRDISTMERVYRWVAGFRMVSTHPWMGFGPNGFYSHYRPYTIRAFETYVSDNPEKSGIHSYFLMTAVEQGIPGLIIFGVLLVFSMVYGEFLYHKIRSREYRLLLMAALLSMVAIVLILLINDMVEAVKVGSFFFINLALIVRVDLRVNRDVVPDEQ